jgi:N-acetylmuramoyl-L-alanine amidase
MNKTISLKKYLLLVFLIVCTVLNAQKKFTIVLDAGHGGTDYGANRTYSDIGRISEKEITLSVTLLVGKMLEKDKDYKVIYTRKEDVYPTLTSRTNLANSSKADLFVSIHVNASSKTDPYGTETYVQGPDQNDTNLEVAKQENDVIYLDAEDKATFSSYDPKSPESLIALKIQQSKYLANSLALGGNVEGNFTQKDKRLSRGVKQKNLHVLRLNAMPSILVEMGFISNYDEAHYLASNQGQTEVAESIYQAITSYRNALERRGTSSNIIVKEKEVEIPLKNDFRILLMSTNVKYDEGHPSLRGLKEVIPIKENGFYKYYFSVTNFASIRDNNLKTAKDAGFRNAYAVGFVPNQTLNTGYYTLEVAVSEKKLENSSPILQKLENVTREKEGRTFYYTWGKANSLEGAVGLQDQLEKKGILNTVIQKVNK